MAKNGSGQKHAAAVAGRTFPSGVGDADRARGSLHRLRAGAVSPRLSLRHGNSWSSTAAVRGLDKHAAEEELNVLLRQLDMEHAMHVKMNQFSKGMLQKINLIQGMLGHPDLLLLDEPLRGWTLKRRKISSKCCLRENAGALPSSCRFMNRS
ncbi:ATP-binding cassette domain-containing protein [Paenibacillus sp. JTLBN-2024]